MRLRGDGEQEEAGAKISSCQAGAKAADFLIGSQATRRLRYTREGFTDSIQNKTNVSSHFQKWENLSEISDTNQWKENLSIGHDLDSPETNNQALISKMTMFLIDKKTSK